MKELYTTVPKWAFLFLFVYLPTHSSAQCLCSDGSAPQQLSFSQTRKITPLDDSTDFFIPQFDPSIGQLGCVELYTRLTNIVRMRLENDETFPLNYRVTYQKDMRLQGPGLTPDLTNSFSKNYGPYALAESDGNPFSGPDYVFIGPDTVMRNKYVGRNITSNVVPFLGNGILTYNYKASGKTTVTGGVNYIFSVNSIDSVTVGVNYNYCTNGLLAVGMRDFNAVRKARQDVLLSWTTQNELSSNRYELEFSTNGTDFRSIGGLKAQTAAGSKSSTYQFPYHFTQEKGTVFFRVKMVSVTGSATYTAIRSLSADAAMGTGLGVYPNPAKQKVMLQFDNPLQGAYEITLVSMNGQTLLSRNINFTHSTQQFEVDLGEKTPAGVYYIRAREVNTNRSFVSKVMVSNQ